MVERWHPTSDSIMLIAKHPGGDYVRYSDYAALEAQLAEQETTLWARFKDILSALEATAPAPKVTEAEAGAKLANAMWGITLTAAQESGE